MDFLDIIYRNNNYVENLHATGNNENNNIIFIQQFYTRFTTFLCWAEIGTIPCNTTFSRPKNWLKNWGQRNQTLFPNVAKGIERQHWKKLRSNNYV